MMLQTTEELRPYIYGAVRIETGEDGFLSFRRLTALQEEVLVRRGSSLISMQMEGKSASTTMLPAALR